MAEQLRRKINAKLVSMRTPLSMQDPLSIVDQNILACKMYMTALYGVGTIPNESVVVYDGMFTTVWNIQRTSNTLKI